MNVSKTSKTLLLVIVIFISQYSFGQRNPFGATTFNHYDIEKFHHIRIVSNISEVHLTHSHHYDVKVNTHLLSSDQIDIHQQNDTLYILTPFNIGGLHQCDIHISLPKLSSIEVVGKTSVYGMNRFHTENLQITTRGKSYIDLKVHANNISVHSSNSSTVNLKGHTQNIDIAAFDNSNIRAHKVHAKYGTIHNYDNSKISFQCKKMAHVNGNDSSTSKSYSKSELNQYNISSTATLKHK